jgi:hypothetical protein
MVVLVLFGGGVRGEGMRGRCEGGDVGEAREDRDGVKVLTGVV